MCINILSSSFLCKVVVESITISTGASSFSLVPLKRILLAVTLLVLLPTSDIDVLVYTCSMYSSVSHLWEDSKSRKLRRCPKEFRLFYDSYRTSHPDPFHCLDTHEPAHLRLFRRTVMAEFPPSIQKIRMERHWLDTLDHVGLWKLTRRCHPFRSINLSGWKGVSTFFFRDLGLAAGSWLETVRATFLGNSIINLCEEGILIAEKIGWAGNLVR